MKKVITLCAVLVMMVFRSVYASPVVVEGQKTFQQVMLNGKKIEIESYLLQSSNYYRLRDLAAVLAETDARFDVGWNAEKKMVTVSIGKKYAKQPQDVQPLKDGRVQGKLDAITLLLDGKEESISAALIEGNYYVHLRAIAELLPLTVDFDQKTKNIELTTEKNTQQEQIAYTYSGMKMFGEIPVEDIFFDRVSRETYDKVINRYYRDLPTPNLLVSADTVENGNSKTTHLFAEQTSSYHETDAVLLTLPEGKEPIYLNRYNEIAGALPHPESPGIGWNGRRVALVYLEKGKTYNLLNLLPLIFSATDRDDRPVPFEFRFGDNTMIEYRSHHYGQIRGGVGSKYKLLETSTTYSLMYSSFPGFRYLKSVDNYVLDTDAFIKSNGEYASLTFEVINEYQNEKSVLGRAEIRIVDRLEK